MVGGGDEGTESFEGSKRLPVLIVDRRFVDSSFAKSSIEFLFRLADRPGQFRKLRPTEQHQHDDEHDEEVGPLQDARTEVIRSVSPDKPETHRPAKASPNLTPIGADSRRLQSRPR